MRPYRTPSFVSSPASPLAALALCLLSGCGFGGSVPATAKNTEGKASTRLPQLTVANSDGVNRCALLTSDEVSSAIGPHGAGSTTVGNVWGLQSCVWTATTVQKFSAYPDGWFDSIEATVFFKDREAWARDQAEGEPVDGMESAVFNATSGEIWFNCGRDRFCAAKVRTASSANRAETAMRFAKLIDKRLQ